MELLFISPRWEKFSHWPFHMSLLGPLTVAGLCGDRHRIYYIDENVEAVDFSLQPDAVLISAMTVQAQRGYEIAARFRAKGITVIMGGLHATLIPEEVSLHVDSVVSGEAEIIWAEIESDLEKGTLKPHYKAVELPDLSCDSFGFPRRDLLRSVGYTKTMQGRRVIDTIQAGRGCSRNCDHCNVPMIAGRRFRPRPIKQVLKEIEQIEAQFLFFVDDSIPECGDYFLPFFQAMADNPHDWMSVGALHLVNDPPLLEAMVKSGCRVLYIGFDRLDPSWRPRKAKQAAHSQYSLDIKKYDIDFTQDYLTNPKPYYEAISRIRAAGISLIGTFAYGFDHDDPSIFEKNMQFALESELDLADFTAVVPYPKSPLAVKLTRENRILTRDWSKYNGMYVVFKPKLMTEEQLMEGIEWSWQEWNKHRPIFRNMIKAFSLKKADSIPSIRS